jgi:ParB family chromosome partitioning protein
VAKFQGLWFAPEALTIVGEDVPEDMCPELADPDRLKSPPLKSLVQSVLEHGIRLPITLRRVQDLLVVVDGRQRVRAARLANRTLRGQDAKIRVPAVMDRSPDLPGAAGMLVLANEHRFEDHPLTRARKAQRLRDLGHGEPEIRAYFGVTSQTLGHWRSLLSLTPAIQAQVAQGSVPVSVGYELGKLTPDDQGPALEALQAQGPLTGQEGRERAKRHREPAETRRGVALSRKALRALEEQLAPTEEYPYENDGVELAHRLILVILGEDPTGKGLREYPEVHASVRKILRSS